MKKQDNQWVSDRFVQFVDIVFGVVVVQGFVRYDWLILDPFSSWFTFLALLSLYVVTTLSWIGYHKSMVTYPYQTESRKSWLRMIADFLIVSIYAYLLFSIQDLAAGSDGANLSRYLLGYVLVFAAYIASGFFRQMETSNRGASKMNKLFIIGSIYVGLFLIYPFSISKIGLSATNWTFIFTTPIVYLVYRLWRHPEYESRNRR